MRHIEQKQPSRAANPQNPLSQENDRDANQRRRTQLVRQIGIEAQHLDTPALLLVSAFLKATTTPEQIDINLSVNTMSGQELYSVRETLLNGRSIQTRKVTFETQNAIVQNTTSTLQYRKANVDRQRVPSLTTQRMRTMLTEYLQTQRYNLKDNRLQVIESLHAEEVGLCDVLHVSDSYGVQGFNGFTTMNHCGVALPGACMDIVLGVAERLCLGYAHHATFVLAQAGTNDFLNVHNVMVDEFRRQGAPLTDVAIITKAERFATHIKFNPAELKKKRPNVKFIVITPMKVHMPDITPSAFQKAYLLEIFNRAAARIMEKRDERGLNEYKLLTIPGVWLLSTDEVHLRAYLTPLMLYRIQEELKSKFGLAHDFIDSVRAVATYYTRGDRAFQRMVRIPDRATRTKRMRANHAEEKQLIKLAMTPKKTKTMDACQLPTLCSELVLGNKGMQIEWTDAQKMGDCTRCKKPDTFIPTSCIINDGMLAQVFINSFVDFERRVPETEFQTLMMRPLKEVLTQDRVTLNAIAGIEEMIMANQGWREYIEAQEKVQAEKPAFRPNIKVSGRTAKKHKESRITHLDIPLKDWVLMTILFEGFEGGPNEFWNLLTKFTEAQMNTIYLLLEMTTIKYIARDKVGMKRINTTKSTLKEQTTKWIRGLIQKAGGGVCQAELELLSGLHVIHLQTILSSSYITMLQGRKMQEPANTPRSWRTG